MVLRTPIATISWFLHIFILFFFYPPPYERTVWDYIQPKTNDIKRDIGRFNWEAFLNNCDVNVQVFIFR